MSTSDLAAVLYVDDDPINLRVFEANFRSRFDVITCGSGEEALEVVTERGAEVGVLLSDQRMQGMTGVELLEKARAINSDIQRMLITAYSDMQAVMDAVNRGQVIRYFVKPWIREELGAVLEDSLRIFGLQSRLREVELRMVRSERLATIGQISAGIAHELMNPVAYITQNVGVLRGELETLSGYAGRLLQAHPDPEVQQSLLDLPSLLSDLETGAAHLRQVAGGVRAQVRPDDEGASSDLADAVSFAVKLSSSEVRRRARISVKGEPVQVRGGQTSLTQVLLNLIINAAHAMEGKPRSGLIEISWSAQGERVVLTVTDDGCGIPPAQQEKVFERQFTTKPVGQGTGLGLSICREKVQAMGGEIRLRSQVGVGTVFEVSLNKA